MAKVANKSFAIIVFVIRMLEQFEGAATALITPLDLAGVVNFRELKKLVEFQCSYAIDGIVLCGTTGQGPLLADLDEHVWYVVNNLAVQAVRRNGRRPFIVIGAGGIETDKGMKLTRYAAELGADATLHDTGYKIGTTQQGYIDYFSSVAGVDRHMDVIMYDVRGRGHPPIESATRVLAAIANSNVLGIKEASGSEEDQKETRRIARDHGFDRHTFKIISGDDPATYRMVTDTGIEAVGVISVMSNLFPQVYATEMGLLLNGNYAEAKGIDDSLAELNSIVGLTVPQTIRIRDRVYSVRGPKGKGENYKNPEAVQFAAYLLGMISSPRLISPLGVLPPEGQAVVGRTLYNLHESHPKYFSPIQEFFRPEPCVADRLMKYKKAI